MPLQATRTYLQMTSAGDLVPALAADPHLRLDRLVRCHASLYRDLYSEVGRAHRWVDRLKWTDREIDAHLAQPAISLWTLTSGADVAGFFELRAHEDGSTEIAYFGLLPRFIGRGLGRHLLTQAVERAWASGATRVWLHTSSLDHPAALSNYRKRGFTVYRAEEYLVETRDSSQ